MKNLKEDLCIYKIKVDFNYKNQIFVEIVSKI